MVTKDRENKRRFLFNTLSEDRRAWIRMVEAVIAISLISTMLIVFVTEENVKKDFNSNIYKLEVNLLRSIENNDEIRNDIINIENLPSEWNDGDFPTGIKNMINNSKPNYLNCNAKICDIRDKCDINEDQKKDIYSRSVGIFTNEREYNPRQLRLFCWEE